MGVAISAILKKVDFFMGIVFYSRRYPLSIQFLINSFSAADKL